MGKYYPVYVSKVIVNGPAATTTAPGTSTYPGPTMIDAVGFRYWTISLYGTFVATVSFWGCIDAQTYNSLGPSHRNEGLVTNTSAIWFPLPVSPTSEGGTAVTTATAPGTFTWYMPLIDFGVNVSAYTSGNPFVKVMVTK